MIFPEEFRLLVHPQFGTRPGQPFGMFLIGGRYASGRSLLVMACDGEETGWEHVSVSVVISGDRSLRRSGKFLCRRLSWLDCLAIGGPPP